jgi:uncharacterized protein YrrD
MLRTVKSLDGYAIRATDDELGDVQEVYFDDEKWAIRYLVVKTGSWLSRRTVLISPWSITGVNDDDRVIAVSLTRDQVSNSPDIDTHQPVSRQLEGEYSRYYGYSNYWTGPYLWGVGGYPSYPMPDAGTVPPMGDELPDEVAARAADAPDDVHLRSSDKVSGYHIEGTDESIGHAEDFLFDDKTWAIHYLLVDTRNWWPGGKKVLVATRWIDRIDWTDSAIHVGLTQEQIKNSPEYDESQPLDRSYETKLHHHYQRRGYWDV